MAEEGFLATKHPRTRLAAAAELVHYRQTGRFLKAASDLPPGVSDQLAAATGTASDCLEGWLSSSRTSRRHRSEILEFLGMRRLTRRDLADAFAFAADELCPRGMMPGALMDRLISWFYERKIECPSEDELVRVTGGARRRFEERVLDTAGGLLPETLKTVLDASLADADPVTGFTGLKADPGKANLENILTAAKRLEVSHHAGGPACGRQRCGEPVIPQARGQRDALADAAASGRAAPCIVCAVSRAPGRGDHRRVGRSADRNRSPDRQPGKAYRGRTDRERRWTRSRARSGSWCGSQRRRRPIRMARCGMSCSRWPAWTRCRRSSASTRRRARSSARCMPCCVPPMPGITGACCLRCCPPCRSIRTTRCTGR